ncbi:hippurate hydrolase [Nakamurella panacisegetis]|uniref:Hippurate hydrolase n=1 Tax=Nakamurella panacisegetis TaxID=1090615 RepID=A0A1H0S010_9ACTN|nr:M20 family metallopeptidase [Nakamurella panacisegetis]SDP34909.1 hippurate hydrolase [Nakamurella panacisegetis]
MNFTQEAAVLGPALTDLRRRLHAVPEVGLQLPTTQRVLLDELDGLGLEITTGTDLTSIVAVLRGGRPGPLVLLRGDMDALPVVERSGEAFAPAADSPFRDAMHACGHDLHMAGLVGAVRLLAAHRAELAGDVLFMFQPGEEGHDGAGRMLDEGLLGAAGRPIDAAYGLHVFSAGFPHAVFAARAGTLMAASAGLEVRVIGAGTHGSMPHRGRDPIPVACEIVTALQTLVTRQFDVFDPVVITVGSFHSGTKRNVIPDDAVFDATVRSFSPGAAADVARKSVALCEGIAAAHGLRAEVTFIAEYPVTVNDDAEFDFAAATIRDLFGDRRFMDLPNPLSGSEDFSRVLDAVPGAYVFLGAGVGDDFERAPTNHSPLAAFDDSVLGDGAALLAELAVRRMARG